jgi:diguanylate cyclase (GGDEF)-like protein
MSEKELNALHRISTALTSTNNSEEVLHLLVEEIAGVVGVVRCSVILADGTRPIARVVATHENPTFKEIKIELKKYPEIQESLRTGEVVFIQDILTDLRMTSVLPNLKKLNIRSILIIPMVYHEQILGTLFLRTSRTRRPFTKTELLFCQVAARIGANALLGLSRYQLVVREKQDLEEEVGRDPLTRVYNHGSLYRRLAEELEAAQRYGRPLCYLMLDIDNFKKVNDTLGHRHGDDLLKRVAKTIQETIRKVDVVARYGGDEFGIILPETSAKGGYAQSERVRKAIGQIRFPLVGGKIRVAASIGVASFPDETIRTAEDLIRKADEVLYRAKTLGKDRTIVFGMSRSR